VHRESPARHRPEDFTLTPLGTWRSPESGAEYPASWRIDVPRHALQLEVRAVMPAQELRTGRSTAVTCGEGAIDLSGTCQGRPSAAAAISR
jgi:predicted secreted hydrolase